MISHSSLFFLEFDLNFVWSAFDFSFFSVFAIFFWTGFSNAIYSLFFLEFDLNFVWSDFDFSFFSVFARFFWIGFSNAIYSSLFL